MNRFKASDRRLDPARSRAIVDELGGTMAVARLFGIRSQSVSCWKRLGIPESRMQSIQLKYRGLPAVKAAADFHPWADRF